MPRSDWFPKPPPPKPLQVALAAIFLLIGLACLVWGAHDLWLAASSAHWSQAPGTVLSSDAEPFTSTDYDRQRSGNKTRFRTSDHPSVSYLYQVGDAQFQGDRIFFGQGFHMSRAEADAILARYPERGRITVYYDPGHPARSVLEPGIRARNWSAAIVGVLFTCLGLSALAGRKKIRSTA